MGTSHFKEEHVYVDHAPHHGQLYYKPLVCSEERPCHGVNHWCVVADPGSHTYKDCLVSVVWSWERQQGVYPPYQELVPGKVVLADEADFDTQMEQFRQQLACSYPWMLVFRCFGVLQEMVPFIVPFLAGCL